MQKIDIHTHILPKTIPKFMQKFGYGGFIELIHEAKKGDSCSCAKMMKDDGTFFRDVEKNCYDPEARIDDLKKDKVDKQVLSTVPVMFSYWAKAKDTLEVARFLNDHIESVCEKYPDNFYALGTVPMQDPELSCMELNRIMKNKFTKGLQIGTHILGKNYSDPFFHEFFEEANKLEVSLFVHPWDMMGKESMPDYFLPWLVGMPAETSRAICSMIFGGIFDKYPKIKVCFAHGGGSFPFTLGRIRHGYHTRPDLCQRDGARDPKEYLDKFYLDTLVHDKDALLYLKNLFGSERLCLGSDYPFPLGEFPAGKLIDSIDEFTSTEKENMLFRSASEWLNLK